MRTLLLIGTAAEIALFLVAVVLYLTWIARSLSNSADSLADVTWGVRAVESQTAVIGPSATKINGQLATISSALSGLADLAEGDGHGTAPQATARG